jgi:hypothetical protein
MRNPRRKRNIGVVWTLLGAIALLAALTFYGSGTIGLLPVVGMVGMMVAIIGIAYSINGQLEVVRYNRLMRGEDVLVRWMIEPDRWRDFLKLNEQLNGQPDNLNCKISDTKNRALRNEGVPVVIGKVSLMVDDDFQSLPVNGITTIHGLGWFEGPPPYLEFRLSARGKSTTYNWAMRIPVPVGGEGDARMVHDYYHSRSAR